MAQHNDVGKKGEALAADYLLKKGYRIIAKNYRFQKAEVDIIAQKGEKLIAVEVKTRSSNYFGNPQDFVTQKKIALLVLAMNHFVTENELAVSVRFDIIAVIKKQKEFVINHLKDAFLFL